jgi:hypothetical protein
MDNIAQNESDAEMSRIQLIVSMRTYDVLMAILSVQDKDVAARVRAAHKLGKLIFDEPLFDGTFIAD